MLQLDDYGIDPMDEQPLQERGGKPISLIARACSWGLLPSSVRGQIAKSCMDCEECQDWNVPTKKSRCNTNACPALALTATLKDIPLPDESQDLPAGNLPCSVCSGRKYYRVHGYHLCPGCGAFQSQAITEVKDGVFYVRSVYIDTCVEALPYALKISLPLKEWMGAKYVGVLSISEALDAIVGRIADIGTDNHKLPTEDINRIRRLVKGKLRRRIFKEFKAWWTAWRATVDADIVLTQKKIFSVLGKVSQEMLMNDKIWTSTYALKDLQKYPAASYLLEKSRMTSDPADWMRLHWCQDQPLPRAYRVTLMSAPRGIPAGLMRDLPHYVHQMTRPLRSRLEILAFLAAVNTYRPTAKAVLFAAEDKALRKAFALYAEHRVRFARVERPKLRKYPDVHEFFSYLRDLPAERFTGTSIVKVTEAAICYHQTIHLQQLGASLRNAGVLETMPTMPLPKPLPDRPKEMVELKVLTTAGGLVDEGQEMGHCVGNYVQKACGLQKPRNFVDEADPDPTWCYIITCQMKNGQRATAEVSSSGEVVQVQGPRNSKSDATRALSALLKGWTKKWPDMAVLTEAARERIRIVKDVRDEPELAAQVYADHPVYRLIGQHIDLTYAHVKRAAQPRQNPQPVEPADPADDLFALFA